MTTMFPMGGARMPIAPRVWLNAAQVRSRYGNISDMTLWRWIHDEKFKHLGFPRPRPLTHAATDDQGRDLFDPDDKMPTVPMVKMTHNEGNFILEGARRYLPETTRKQAWDAIAEIANTGKPNIADVHEKAVDFLRGADAHRKHKPPMDRCSKFGPAGHIDALGVGSRTDIIKTTNSRLYLAEAFFDDLFERYPKCAIGPDGKRDVCTKDDMKFRAWRAARDLVTNLDWDEYESLAAKGEAAAEEFFRNADK